MVRATSTAEITVTAGAPTTVRATSSATINVTAPNTNRSLSTAVITVTNPNAGLWRLASGTWIRVDVHVRRNDAWLQL